MKKIEGTANGLILQHGDVAGHRQVEQISALCLKLWEIASTHSLGETMQEALDEIGCLTDSPIGFYHFVEADQKSLSLQAWSTRTRKEFCKTEASAMHYNIDAAGVWVDCIHQRRPVIHNDYESLSHRKGMPPGHAKVIRELVVPILRKGKIVSILGVGNKSTDYNEKDVEMVSHIADVIWEIIERKKTEEEVTFKNLLLSTQLETATEGILVVDGEDKIALFNRRFVDIWHLSSGNIGSESRDLILKAMSGLLIDPSSFFHIVDHLNEHRNEISQDEISLADGRILDYYSAPMFGPHHKYYGRAWYFLDITERKCAEMEKEELSKNLKERVKELNCLYSISSIIEIPNISKIERFNKIVSVIPPAWQYSDITCAKIKITDDEYKTANYKETKWQQTSDITVNGTKVGYIKVCYLEERSEIDEGPFLQQERSLINAIAEHLSLFIDRMKAEEDLKASEERFRELSIVDHLTQLYNSRHFYNQLQKEFNRANRYKDPLTLILLDVDNFKAFNDIHGHIEGDQILIRLGQVIKRCLRKTDSAYRYGGEEFIILLPMTTCEDGTITAERIRAEFKKEKFSLNYRNDTRITLSIGVSQYKPEEEMKTFVHRVDQLMYQAKNNGKDRVCYE